MNKKFKLTSMFLATVMLVSCGGSEGNKSVQSTNKLDIKVSIVEPDDPCLPKAGPTILTISDGVAPYSVKAEYTDGSPVEMEFGEFITNDDGSVKVKILSMPGAYNEEGDKIQFIITDAESNIQKFDFTLVYCY